MEKLNAIANALTDWIAEKGGKKKTDPEQSDEEQEEGKAKQVKKAFNKKLHMEDSEA